MKDWKGGHKQECNKVRQRSPGEQVAPREVIALSYQLAPTLPFQDLDSIASAGLEPWRISSSSMTKHANPNSPTAADLAEPNPTPMNQVEGFPLVAKISRESGRQLINCKDAVHMLFALRAVLQAVMVQTSLMSPSEALTYDPKVHLVRLGSDEETSTAAAALLAHPSEANGNARGDISKSSMPPRAILERARMWVHAWPDWMQSSCKVCCDFMLSRAEQRTVKDAVPAASTTHAASAMPAQSPNDLPSNTSIELPAAHA